MNYSNPIKYTSITFNDIISDINSDPRTKDSPYWLKVIFAGIFTLLAIRINIALNQMFSATVEDRSIASDIFAEQDYQLRRKECASVLMDITIDPYNTRNSSFTIPASNLKGTTLPTLGVIPVKFEARDSLSIPQGSTTGVVYFYHQETRNPVSIGTTSNGNPQSFIIHDLDVLPETLWLEIGGERYDLVDSFVYSSSIDKHFILKSLSTGESVVTLGFIDQLDGTQYGKIPAIGLDIIANYAVGGGEIGNQLAGSIINYTGGNSAILAINNPSGAQGGTEEETLENAKQMAPLRSKTHDMFWDEDSGVAIAKNVPGVLDAQIIMTGVLRCNVIVLPYGGGVPTQNLLNSVQKALIAKSFFESVNVSVSGVSYLYTGISGKVKMKTGFSFTAKLPFIQLAAVLRSHPISFYIQEYYVENGLQLTIDLINSSFASLIPFVFDYSRDLIPLKRILDSVKFQNLGDSLGPEDIETAIMGFVDGVDFVEMSNPSSRILVLQGQTINPSSVGFTEI